MNTTHLMQDRYIHVDSINTRYWCAGTQGNPVILLHGGGGSIEVWEQNIQALAQHHRVFAFDMVGAGLSDKPAAAYSLDYQLQFLKAFLDRLEIQTASLIGNSMGGSIALKFALESPERVSSLGLISSFGLGREIDMADRLLAAFPAIAKRIPLSRRGVRMVLHSCVYDSKSVPETWVDLNYQRFNLPGQKEALMSLLIANLDFWGVRREVFSPIIQHLDRIKIPTLIIWGKQDSIMPVVHAYAASQKILNCIFLSSVGIGHRLSIQKNLIV